jgi:ribonuclease D
MKIVYITSLIKFKEVLDTLLLYEGDIALDTETQGLDPYTHKIVLLQLAIAREEKCFVVNVKKIGALWIPAFKSFIENDTVRKKNIFLAHNFKFDIKMLWQQG